MTMMMMMMTIKTTTQCQLGGDVAVVCLGAGYAGRALLSRLYKTFERIAPDRTLKLTATCPLTALDDTREWAESSELPVQILDYDLGEVGRALCLLCVRCLLDQLGCLGLL